MRFTELIHTSLANYLLLVDKGRVVKTGKSNGGRGVIENLNVNIIKLKFFLKDLSQNLIDKLKLKKKKIIVELVISRFGGGIYRFKLQKF